MPPENLETVFERFYTSRPKGAAFGGNSGLGLSIARQIVEAHGGRIWAENRPTRRRGRRRAVRASACRVDLAERMILHAGLVALRLAGRWRGRADRGRLRRRQERPGAARAGRGLSPGGRRPGGGLRLRRRAVRPRARHARRPDRGARRRHRRREPPLPFAEIVLAVQLRAEPDETIERMPERATRDRSLGVAVPRAAALARSRPRAPCEASAAHLQHLGARARNRRIKRALRGAVRGRAGTGDTPLRPRR